MTDHAARSAAPYAYDTNGNMAVDPGRNITVAYNHLNLPQCVSFPGGEKIFYCYDVSGRKLAQSLETPTGEGDKLTEYVGAAVYTDGQPSFVAHEEGRIVPDNGGGWRYEYFLKDHLGNTRAVVAGTLIPGSADVLQTTSYYPFGLTMSQTDHNTVLANYRENRYLYNGKELQGDGFGGVELGWYDYGARMYDPALGRWHTEDPLAEKYPGVFSYVYCLNNPIIFIDPDGMEVDVSNMSEEDRKRYETQVALQRANSKLFDAMYSSLESSKQVYLVQFGQTPSVDGKEPVDGIFVPNKDGGGTVTFLEGQETIKSGTLSEEFFHAYQNDNKNDYSKGEFNLEFEAKVATTAIGSESTGYGAFAGMGEFQSKVGLGDYSKGTSIISSDRVTSMDFQSNYNTAANNYATYNKENNIGNDNYKKSTTVAPFSLMLLIKKAYGK
ncbi:MAG: RHS repeat-associated core domain-containing protein [Breznakibacter sp.]